MKESTQGLYIGLDVGTQSTKGLVVDTSKTGAAAVVARASVAYDLIAGLPNGAAEQHPHTWRDAIASVVRELLTAVSARSIRGIGVSGQQHGLVVLDADNQVIRPAKLWCDTTTAAEADAITKQGGRVVPTGFTLPKLLWLKNNEPQNYARIRRVLLPHDYVNFLLTGKCFMEAGDASGSGAFIPESRTFDRALLDWLDPAAHTWFPELVPADMPAGTLSRDAASWLGLPEGIPVSPGAGDNMASAIGSGASKPGVAVVSLGTSGTAFAFASHPVVDPKGEIAAFCDSTGGWLPLLCTMNMTTVSEEVRHCFGLSHAELTERAVKVPAGANGLTFLPYLAGERTPNLPHATGSLLGLRAGLLEPGHLYRAAIEGATLALAAGVRQLQELGLSIDDVRVVGGGAKNPLWRQILSDILGATVRSPLELESAALGAALQAFWVTRRATGEQVTASAVAEPFIQLSNEVAKPNPGNTEVYRAELERFRAATRALHGN